MESPRQSLTYVQTDLRLKLLFLDESSNLQPNLTFTDKAVFAELNGSKMESHMLLAISSPWALTQEKKQNKTYLFM